jgi:Protein of unknown function (DUF3592)
MTKQARLWIIGGAALDLGGAVLIARNVPQIGPPLAAGVGLLLIGSVMVFQGVLRSSREQAGRQPASRDALPGWSPEPELSGAPPRPVRLSRTGMLSAGLWGVMAAVVVGYLFLAPPRAAPVPQLLEVAGATATATVHAKNERQTAAGGPTYYVSYHFVTVQGSQVRESQRVPRAVYDDVVVGDSFEVIYFPENPQQSFAARLERREIPPVVRWIAIGVLAAMLFVFDLQRRFHKRLVAYGKPVAGLVEGVRRRGANRVFTVRYKLHGQEGQLRGSERNPQRADGDAVTVLYLPERPERALLYRTSLYRAKEA